MPSADLIDKLKSIGTTQVQIRRSVTHPAIEFTTADPNLHNRSTVVTLEIEGRKAEAYADFIQMAAAHALDLASTPNATLETKYKHLPSFPRIVCAAMRLPDGYIITSARHFDCTVRATCRRLGLTAADTSDAEQGFIDNFGNFYSRAEAWHVAVYNKQIIRRVGGDNGKLYSENLY